MMSFPMGGGHGTPHTDDGGHEAPATDPWEVPEPRLPFHLAGGGRRDHLDPATHLLHYRFNRTAADLVRVLGAHLEAPELRAAGSLNRHARGALRDALDENQIVDLVDTIQARLLSPQQLDCRRGCEVSLGDIAALPVKARVKPLRMLASRLGGVPGDRAEMGEQVLRLAEGLPDDDRLAITEAVTRAIAPG